MKASLIFFLIFSISIKAQNTRDAESLFTESKNLRYTKPKESAVIAEFLLKNSSSENDKIKALILSTESDILIANYTSATEKLFQALELSKQSNRIENKIQINALLERLCNELGIEYSQLYLIIDEKETTPNYYEKAIDSYSRSNWKQTIKSLKQSEKQKSNKELTNFYYALSYSDLGKIDSAQYYLNKIQKYEPYYFFAKAKIQSDRKESDKNMDYLEFLKPINQKVQDVWLKGEIYKLATENFQTSKDWENYRTYYQLQNALQDSINLVKENARISLLTKIDQKQDEILASKSSYQKRIIYVILITIFAVLLIAFLLNRRFKRKKTNIAKALMEAEEKQRFIDENKTPENAGKIVIPDKTIQFLLEKLENFEANGNYTNPSTSLNQLAESLNTNTKYLSEIINTYKNKNFHTYINELRINYIINKLKTDTIYLKYKVSHLAEEAGFSSHSLFSTVFKQMTGHSPASYIKLIKNEQDGKA